MKLEVAGVSPGEWLLGDQQDKKMLTVKPSREIRDTARAMMEGMIDAPGEFVSVRVMSRAPSSSITTPNSSATLRQRRVCWTFVGNPLSPPPGQSSLRAAAHR
jgi:hypothetical protein